MKRASSTYAELADVLASLPLILRETRRARGVSLSFSTVTRIEHGDDATLSSVVAIMRWIDQSGTDS